MGTVSDYFGCLVFDDRVMKARLNADIYQSLRKTIDQGAKLDAGVANAVAAAMKDWAVEHGATHYTHWFQPLTGITAEKQELHMYDVLRADRCISVNSLEARVPFGDLDFVKYVMAIDPEMKLNKYGKGKYLLRHAFEGLGYLPDDILWREKAAFSDAVGHSMVDYLKAFAEKYFTDAEFEAENLEYDHARPFTKESLLYRELFEKYYPNQSQMIIDFWMPICSPPARWKWLTSWIH